MWAILLWQKTISGPLGVGLNEAKGWKRPSPNLAFQQEFLLSTTKQVAAFLAVATIHALSTLHPWLPFQRDNSRNSQRTSSFCYS